MQEVIGQEEPGLTGPSASAYKKGRGGKALAKRKSSGRVCRACGKDPYPNYFYCPPCHHRISHSGMEDEHEEHHI